MKRIGFILLVIIFILSAPVVYADETEELAVFVNGVKYEIDYTTQTVAIPKGSEVLTLKRGKDPSGNGQGFFPIIVVGNDSTNMAIPSTDEAAIGIFYGVLGGNMWENARYDSEKSEYILPISEIKYVSESDGIRGIYLMDENTSGFTLKIKEVEMATDTYDISTSGSGKDDVTAPEKATAGSDVTFTLTKQEGYTYYVQVVIDGYSYTGFLVDGDTYTIPGSAITGNIVITVIKEAIPVHTHTPGAVVKENEHVATCTKAGSYDEVVYCTECGEEISRDTKTIEALGHDWDEGTVTEEPTLEKEGVKTFTCNRCGETRTESIPKLTPSENVVNIINALPTEVKLEDKEQIETARAAYETLTTEEKEAFPELALAKLELAEAKLAAAQAEADKKTAEEAAAQAEADKKAAEDAAAQAEADKKAAEEAAAQSDADKKAAEDAAAQAEADKKAAEDAAAQAEADKKAAEEAAAQADADKKAAEEALAEAQAKLEAAQKEAEEAKVAQLKAEAKNYKVKGLKVTVKNRKFTVKYSKNSKATGYQIQYKLKTAKKYTYLKKTYTKLKATTKKLKKGKVYQFRVRTYTKVDGEKVYGQWSAVKSVKCK